MFSLLKCRIRLFWKRSLHFFKSHVTHFLRVSIPIYGSLFFLISEETQLWTGIKKGPPRKLKFPQPDDVVAALQEALKLE